MSPLLIAGSTIVTLALVSYSIAFFGFLRKKIITNSVLRFQTTGLLLDITATALMIAGSSNGPFTFHGLLGYSSLSLMIADTILFWSKRKTEPLTSWVKSYSNIAYSWWIVAYITGSLLVILK